MKRELLKAKQCPRCGAWVTALVTHVETVHPKLTPEQQRRVLKEAAESRRREK